MKAKAELAGRAISENAETFANASLGFAIICIFCPYRWMINKCIEKNEALESEIKYRDVFLTFSTDYDKENPLTAQKGYLRIIEIQME